MENKNKNGRYLFMFYTKGGISRRLFIYIFPNRDFGPTAFYK